MRYVQELLKEKGYDIWSVAMETTVFDALKLMAEKDIGALPVLKGEKLVGIFSERDYARKVVLAGKTSMTTRVEEIMSREVVFVRPDMSCEDCMVFMTNQHIRHLPVMEDNKLIGLVSIGDVVKAIITTQGYEIRQLENYITGLLHGK
jgi:CBS domain-containing protein